MKCSLNISHVKLMENQIQTKHLQIKLNISHVKLVKNEMQPKHVTSKTGEE